MTGDNARVKLNGRRAAGCARFNAWLLERLRSFPADVPVVFVNRATCYMAGEKGAPGEDRAGPLIIFAERRDRAVTAPSAPQRATGSAKARLRAGVRLP